MTNLLINTSWLYQTMTLSGSTAELLLSTSMVSGTNNLQGVCVEH